MFVQELLKEVEDSPKEMYSTRDRIKGLLTVVSEVSQSYCTEPLPACLFRLAKYRVMEHSTQYNVCTSRMGGNGLVDRGVEARDLFPLGL